MALVVISKKRVPTIKAADGAGSVSGSGEAWARDGLLTVALVFTCNCICTCSEITDKRSLHHHGHYLHARVIPSKEA